MRNVTRLPDRDHQRVRRTGRRRWRRTVPAGFEVLERRLMLDGDATSEIHGTKWNDLNADRTWDVGEPGLPDWTVFLDVNQNGQLDPGESSTTTDANGQYAFTGLAPGTYRVLEVLPSG